MNNSTPLVLALACALGAAAVTAIAQQMPSDPPAPAAAGTPSPGNHRDSKGMHAKHFAEMDTNHDGKISKEEMLAAMEKRDAERAKKRGEFVDAMFKRLDTDGDGMLSQDELAKVRGPGAWGDHKGQRPHMDMKPAQ